MRLRRRDSQRRPRARRSPQTPEDERPNSPASFSYGARRADQPRQPGRQSAEASRPEDAHWLSFWLRRLGLLVLLLALVASIVNVLSLSSSAKVLPLEKGNQTFLRPAAVYQAAADQALRASFWNHNKATIDTKGIERQLRQQFPELSQVKITVPLLSHRPLIYVQAVKPALILVTSNGAFIVDDTGKALVKANSVTELNQPGLPTLNDQGGLPLRVGDQALPTDDVKFIREVTAQLAAKQYKVTTLSLPAASSQLDVQLAGQPYIVKFNLQSNNPRGEAGTFLAAINKLNNQHVTPSKYVDVRVDGRAYYQ